MAQGKRYEETFKKQIVALFNGGKSLADLNKEYGIAKSTIKTWIERLNNSGSLNIDDSRTEEEKELIILRKKVKQLKIMFHILERSTISQKLFIKEITKLSRIRHRGTNCRLILVKRSLKTHKGIWSSFGLSFSYCLIPDTNMWNG